MSTNDMIAAVEEEIARLQLIRKLLSGESSAGKNGFVSKSVKARKASATGRIKRVLSPEARERIASAQRKRWAAAKKAGRKAARQTA